MCNGVKVTEEEKVLFAENPFIDDKDSLSSRRSLPSNFIFWDEYPECDNRPPVQQGGCGNCWIACAIQNLNDRFCYQHAKEGIVQESYYSNIDISFQHPTSCWNEELETSTFRDVCEGGWPREVFEFMRRDHGGILHDSSCFGAYGPYVKDGIQNSWSGSLIECPISSFSTWKCPAAPFGNNETDEWMHRLYTNNDRSYDVVSGLPSFTKIEDVKQELYDHGPLSVVISVYSDFQSYDGGIYEYSGEGDYEGLHAVELIGWGTNETHEYWILKNSWSENWGERQGKYNGYFRVLSGRNEIGILNTVYIPNINTSMDCNHHQHSSSSSSFSSSSSSSSSTFCQHGSICIGDHICDCNYTRKEQQESAEYWGNDCSQNCYTNIDCQQKFPEEKPFCSPEALFCVECLSNFDCFYNTANEEQQQRLPICLSSNNICSGCISDEQCKQIQNNLVCDAPYCVQCRNSSDCFDSSTPYCDLENQKCSSSSSSSSSFFFNTMTSLFIAAGSILIFLCLSLFLLIICFFLCGMSLFSVFLSVYTINKSNEENSIFFLDVYEQQQQQQQQQEKQKQIELVETTERIVRKENFPPFRRTSSSSSSSSFDDDDDDNPTQIPMNEILDEIDFPS